MSYHSRADYSKVLPMFVLIKMNKWLRVCREWKRKDIKGKFICVPLLVRTMSLENRQSANGMKQLCDLLRRENSATESFISDHVGCKEVIDIGFEQ